MSLNRAGEGASFASNSHQKIFERLNSQRQRTVRLFARMFRELLAASSFPVPVSLLTITDNSLGSTLSPAEYVLHRFRGAYDIAVTTIVDGMNFELFDDRCELKNCEPS